MIISSTKLCELVKEQKTKAAIVFPELIERLIKASVNKAGYIRFPSGDAVFTPGADGLLKGIISSNGFVPEGDSFWEIGTNQNALKKIRTDYNKRIKTTNGLNLSDYTYIAVTPFVLDSTKKQSLCDKWTKDGFFKKVLIFDANDLESWLKCHVEVCIWFLQECGRQIGNYGIVLPKDELEMISDGTSPSLQYKVFLLGNESYATKLFEDIQGQTKNEIYTISSPFYGREHAYYFCLAAILHSGDGSLIDRCIIVNSQTALDYVSTCCEEKVIIVNCNCTNYRFLHNPQNTYILLETDQSGIRLNLISRSDFVNALVSMGFSNGQASRTAFMVDYNVLALKRLLSKAPTEKLPKWAKEKYKSELIPLMLLGEINVDNEGDIDVLKSIVGENYDDFFEKLNYWTEQPEPPVIKVGSVYRISSRKESFDNVQVDCFLIVIKKLENKLLEILSVTDKKYYKEKSEWLINDGSYIWREALLNHIIESFIILAEKRRENQLHFDRYAEKIYEKLFGDYHLSLTVMPILDKIVELSPKAFLEYINKSLSSDKKTFGEILNTSASGIVDNSFSNYILWAIDRLLANKNTVAMAFDILLKIYDNYSNVPEIKESLITVMSPVSTMCGKVALPLQKKADVFFEFIEGKEVSKYIDVVKKIQEGGPDYVVSPDINSYRPQDELPNEQTTWQEYFALESRAMEWLLANSNQNEQVDAIRSILDNISRKPRDLMMGDFEAIRKTLNSIKDDLVLAQIKNEILHLRERIIKFSWLEYAGYLDILGELALLATPKEVYYQHYPVLFYSKFPLENPPLYSDSKWLETEESMREDKRKESIRLLISVYGQGIIERIIKDSNKSVYAIWPMVFTYSDDHLRDLRCLIEHDITPGLKYYLKRLDIADIKMILNETVNRERIIANLPYRKDVFELIKGDNEEKLYWESQNGPTRLEELSDYVFEKFIENAPLCGR